jgi:hypothetical protein
MSNSEFTLDILPNEVQVVDCHSEFKTNVFVVLGSKAFVFVFSNFVTVETILKCEAMRDLELFPGNYSCCSYLVRLYSEP